MDATHFDTDRQSVRRPPSAPAAKPGPRRTGTGPPPRERRPYRPMTRPGGRMSGTVPSPANGSTCAARRHGGIAMPLVLTVLAAALLGLLTLQGWALLQLRPQQARLHHRLDALAARLAARPVSAAAVHPSPVDLPPADELPAGLLGQPAPPVAAARPRRPAPSPSICSWRRAGRCCSSSPIPAAAPATSCCPTSAAGTASTATASRSPWSAAATPPSTGR